MKTMMKNVFTLLLAFCLLLSAFPAAALYEWVDGEIPAGWDRITDAKDITATNILNPINPHASQEAKNLLAYLGTLTDSNQFISGQFDIQNTDSIWERTKEQLGIEPGLYSNRYIVDTTMPTFDANGAVTNTSMEFQQVEEANALLKKHYDKGNILLVHSDDAQRQVCADLLIQKGKYSDNANAIIELDASNPDRDMQAYALWTTYMDNLIVALKALEASGVKAYMYRPWIEFNYNNFNGVTEEGYVAFTRVFQQTVQTLIDSGLTGFLLTYSPGHKLNTLQRYPGNEYVDVLSATLYSEWDLLGQVDRSYGFPNYEWYVKTGKPMGFSEFSCRDGNVSENQGQARASWYTLLQDVMTYWPKISWVNAWADNTFSMLNNSHMPEDGNDDGMAYITSPFVLNLDDLVDYRNQKIAPPGIAQLYLSGESTYRGMEQRDYTAADLKALGIDLSKLAALRLNEGHAVTFYSGDDCTGESWGYAEAQQYISAKTAAKFRSCTVSALQNVGYEAYINDATDSDGVWKVNDGYSSMWETTADPVTGSTWVVIELDEPANVAGYAVKTAGYGGRLSMYNVRDFQLQFSKDGQTWTTLDTVTGNTASQVNRSIKAVVGQYFRLLITGANSAIIESERNVVVLAEWELLGVSAGAVSTEPEPEPTTTTTKKVTTTTKKVTTTTKKTTKKTTTTTALKLAIPKVTVSNATKGIKVSWNKVSKADKYYVYRKTGSGDWSKIKTVTATSYTDESAKAGKSYKYMVKAVKGKVTSGYKATDSITRLSVPKVTAANASKGIKVSWGKVSKATSYRVYRRLYSSGKWGSWSKIKTTTSTSHTDTKAKVGKNYQYMVKAVKGDFTSYYKATATIRRLKAPASVKLTKATKGFKVSWSKSTGATKYEVYRKVGNGKWSKVTTTTKTAYTDKTAKKGKYYTYRVRAVYSSSKSTFKTGSKTKR